MNKKEIISFVTTLIVLLIHIIFFFFGKVYVFKISFIEFILFFLLSIMILVNFKNDYFKKNRLFIFQFSFALSILSFISIAIVCPTRVSGKSMNNSLKDNQLVFANQMFYKVERYDIVVIEFNGELIVKRIIGLPGEKVELVNDKIYIDDKEIKQDFEYIYNNYDKNTVITNETLGEEEYFVLGDNRSVSYDSTEFGPVNKSNIVGKLYWGDSYETNSMVSRSYVKSIKGN